MNGLESYIFSKLDTDDITWLPIKRALTLEQNETEKETIVAKIKKL